MPEEATTCPEIKERVCEDRLSALPADLLVQILFHLPTKEAVSTAVLSKQWLDIWMFVPKLACKDTKHTNSDKSVWWFLEKSLQQHKTPILEHLEVKLRSVSPGDVDVGKLILNAIQRYVRVLDFNLKWSTKAISLPNRLYTCKTLKELSLSNKILIDIPYEAFLPSLTKLDLIRVVYKNEGSLVNLLSSCPVLKTLVVVREKKDNVKNFSVEVSSLNTLAYTNNGDVKVWRGGSLILDSPQLKYLRVTDYSIDDCLIKNMNPNLTMARVDVLLPPTENLLTCLSSVMFLQLSWRDETELFCSGVYYPRLKECMLGPCLPEYWGESVMLLINNAPNLKVLMLDTKKIGESEDIPPWSYVPKCLSSQLEILEWAKYGGTREEKKLLTYILANSKCLKRAGISMRYSNNCKDKMKKKLRKELRSMYRASPSSELLFPAKMKWRSVAQHPLFTFDCEFGSGPLVIFNGFL